MVLPHQFSAILLLATDVATKPVNPLGSAGIVVWIVCSLRKRYSIGGWLLFYFWQIFSGAAMTAFFLTSTGYRAYMPEIHHSVMNQWLFFISAAPQAVLLFMQAGAALMLLCVRTWDALQLVRYIALATAAFAWIGALIAGTKFHSDLPIQLIGAVQMSVWAAYLFASKRVERVFKYDDWEQATPTSTLGIA